MNVVVTEPFYNQIPVIGDVVDILENFIRFSDFEMTAAIESAEIASVPCTVFSKLQKQAGSVKRGPDIARCKSSVFQELYLRKRADFKIHTY